VAIRHGVHAVHVCQGKSDPRIPGDLPRSFVVVSHTSGGWRVNAGGERFDPATTPWSTAAASAERASLNGVAAMRREVTAVVLMCLVSGCAGLADTPEQNVALSRWTACHARVTGTDLHTVSLDGRISFWYSGGGEGQSMLECLRQTATTGPSLPEPIAERRPAGSGGGGGAM
jgi:hypothetical protein